jgi:hypothetical protein
MTAVAASCHTDTPGETKPATHNKPSKLNGKFFDIKPFVIMKLITCSFRGSLTDGHSFTPGGL